MRILTGSVFLLMVAGESASSSEAFIAQVTNRGVVTEQVSAKLAFGAAMLALPIKPAALNPSVQMPSAAPGTNVSALVQIGTSNTAAISQAGGGNASSIVQHGIGNQASVTQRTPR